MSKALDEYTAAAAAAAIYRQLNRLVLDEMARLDKAEKAAKEALTLYARDNGPEENAYFSVRCDDVHSYVYDAEELIKRESWIADVPGMVQITVDTKLVDAYAKSGKIAETSIAAAKLKSAKTTRVTIKEKKVSAFVAPVAEAASA